jgi:hypothetical protein
MKNRSRLRVEPEEVVNEQNFIGIASLHWNITLLAGSPA